MITSLDHIAADALVGKPTDPLADVAYQAMPYFLPPLPQGPLTGFAGLRDLEGRFGLPTLEQHRAAYASAADGNATIARAEPHWLLFCSVAYFRVAAICQGVYARSKAGQASAANAGAVGALATTTADIAWELAQKHAASVS